VLSTHQDEGVEKPKKLPYEDGCPSPKRPFGRGYFHGILFKDLQSAIVDVEVQDALICILAEVEKHGGSGEDEKRGDRKENNGTTIHVTRHDSFNASMRWYHEFQMSVWREKRN